MSYTQKLLPNRTSYNWRLVKRNKHTVSLCTRVMFYSATALACAGVALAQPTGGVVTGGTGAITQDGTATNINQATQRLDIDWQTFSTQVNESINFFQPSASAIAINRVVGGVPSQLRGALNANGRVFILNDSGITFFGSSQVNVGALVASTASDFTSVDSVFSFRNAGYAQIINDGAITVSDGGFAILAAPYVANSGVITANLGQIHLAAATAYTLDLRGDGRITFTVDADAVGDIAADGRALGIDNSGTLQARSGAVVVTAATMSKVVSSVVNLDGVVDADAMTADGNGGTVLIKSSGDMNFTGAVTAQGGAESGDGGYVELSGEHVLLQGDVTIGAGGTLFIDPTDILIKDGAGDGAADGNDTFAGDPSGTTGTVLGSDTGPTEIFESELEDQLQAGTNVIIASLPLERCQAYCSSVMVSSVWLVVAADQSVVRDSARMRFSRRSGIRSKRQRLPVTSSRS